MGVRLTIKMKGAAGEQPRTVTLDDDEILLGREATCQVQLAQMAVSRNHARITHDGPLFFIEDLGSSYGTLLNGERLVKAEKHVLKNGDLLAIAQFDVTFECVAQLEQDANANPGVLIRGVMGGLAPGGQHAYFRLMNGPSEGQQIDLADAQEYVFGRDGADADIVLNHDLVSRTHAKVRRDWSGTHIEDLKSRNGIKVNKRRVTRATLKDRDEVEIGGMRLLFIDPSEVREEQFLLVDEPVPEPEEEGEGTVAMSDEPEPEPEPDPPQEAPPPEEPEPEAHANTHEAQVPEEEYDDEAAEDGEDPGPRKLIDFSNRQTVIALAIGGVLLVMGIVLLVLLLAGA